MSDTKPSKLYWILTGLLGLFALGAGFANLLHAQPQVEAVVQKLGYPEYLLTILGVAKLSAAVVILAPRLPRLKEWAYAGLMIDFVGASASHALAGEGIVLVLVPLLVAALTMGSWVARPPSRRLA